MKPISTQRLSEYWFRSQTSRLEARALRYKPALMVECNINFRSLRAGLNHSEVRNYTAWVPEAGLAIDWSAPALPLDEEFKFYGMPDEAIAYVEGEYDVTDADFEQYEWQLISLLVRRKRLQLYFNPVFGLFSTPDDSLEEFLSRVAEAALGRVEPEMKRLRNKFELQLEQIREARADNAVSAEELSDALINRNRTFMESENRLAEMFSTLAGTVFGTTTKARNDGGAPEWADYELREDLARVEQEASEALGALYEEYIALAKEYDHFDIGIQPDNVQLNRSSLVWVAICRE